MRSSPSRPSWLCLWLLVAMGVIAASCATDAGPEPDWPNGTATGEVQLTAPSPRVSVEFEGSFVSVPSSGIVALARREFPDSDEEERLGISGEWEYWDGRIWQTRFDRPGVEASGLNTFRYRWTFTLVEGTDQADVDFEVSFAPVDSAGLTPISADEVSEVQLRIVSVTENP